MFCIPINLFYQFQNKRNIGTLKTGVDSLTDSLNQNISMGNPSSNSNSSSTVEAASARTISKVRAVIPESPKFTLTRPKVPDIKPSTKTVVS